MALATKCPHCNTIFRVAHDQLKLRGGIVRCGACNEVFDGNAALLEPPVRPAAPPPASPPSPLPPAVPFDAAMAALDTRAATALQPAADDTNDTLDLDTADADTAAIADSSGPAGTGAQERYEDGETGSEAKPVPAAGHAAGPAHAGADSDGTAAAAMTPAAPDTPSSAAYVPPVTAYAPSRAPFAAPPAPVYAGGIDATPSLPPMPPAAAEDKLELDFDVDLEPATNAPDWDAPSSAESTASASLADKPTPDYGFASDSGAHAEHDAAPAAAAASHHADGHAIIEPDPFSAFTRDEAFQLEPDAAADAGSALAIESDGQQPLNALADGRREPTWGEPSAAEPAAAAAPAGQPGQPDSDDEDEVLVDLSPAARAHSEAPLPLTASRADDDAGPADHAAAEHQVSAGDEQEEPGFVKRDRRRQRLDKLATIAMSVGSVLLVGALVGQAGTTFRNQLAANVPQLKPALQALCTVLGCKVELPAQIDYVTIEQGELQTLSENTFSFTTLLRNQATTAQAWPDIELILDDASDKAVLRRVFTPRDYLGLEAELGKGFAPHSEQSVKLYFELRQLKASGYHIAVFYP
jgi:predicted Zn finger-like uncharacterized protein